MPNDRPSLVFSGLDRCQPVCGCGPHCVADRGRCGRSARGHEQFGADNGPVSDDELGMRTWNEELGIRKAARGTAFLSPRNA